MSYITVYPSIQGSIRLSIYPLSQPDVFHCHLPPVSPHPGVFTSPLVTESIHTSGWLACHDVISCGLDVKGRVVLNTSDVFTHLGTLGGARLGREGTVGGGPL